MDKSNYKYSERYVVVLPTMIGWMLRRLNTFFSASYERFILLSFFEKTLVAIAGAGAVWMVRLVFKYRKAIRKRVEELEAKASKVMVRTNKTAKPSLKFQLLELNPAFVEKHKKEWQLISLGSYMATLRPAMLPEHAELPSLIQSELENALGSILLRYLGPRWGKVALPTIGNNFIQARLGTLATSSAGWWARHFKSSETKVSEDSDRGTFPLSLQAMSTFADLNARTAGMAKLSVCSLDLMSIGEVGYNPSFNENIPNTEEKLIPNPFVVEDHWERALLGMEELIRSQAEGESTYDPDDKSYPPPTPINNSLFPDLYLGWGDAQMTHTKREVLRNRLFCIILNRLSFNYRRAETGDDDDNVFVLKMNDTKMTRPHEFVEALMESGHTISVCPRTALTTFGVAACVKESDGSWSNVPLAYFLQTGYEDASGQGACLGMPHGGLDLDITGPLVEGSRANVQFYVAIEGLCGWHSNHNVDAPWIRGVSTCPVYEPAMAVDAVRLSSLCGVVLNCVATEMELPFGGYGLTGVCNDTAAIVDWALRGETNMHPLTSVGRFLLHVRRRMQKFKEALSQANEMEREVEDLDKLMRATTKVPSDLLASPTAAEESARRMLECFPPDDELAFALSVDCKRIMENLLEEVK